MLSMLLSCCVAANLALSPDLPAIPPGPAPLLYAVVPDADREHADLSLLPATPFGWILAPGEALQAKLHAGLGEQLALTVWNWDNQPVRQLSFETPVDEPISLNVEGRGTWLLTVDAVAGGKVLARLSRSFAVCPDNRARRQLWRDDEFLLGACGFPGRQHWGNDFGPAHPPGLTEQQSRELEARLVARLGLQVQRVDIGVVWRGADQPMDFTRCDAGVEAFAALGLKLDIQFSLPYPADWIVKQQYRQLKEPLWRFPAEPTLYPQFATAIAQRYAKVAQFFELGNEDDNDDFWRGTPEEYVAQCRSAAAAIRAVAPRATIVNGGYTLMRPEVTGYYLRELRDTVDEVAYHSHGDLANLRWSYRAMAAATSAAGYDRPKFWNTEMGYANWRLDQERASAATGLQKVLFCWAHRHRGALVYNSRGIGGPRLPAGDPDWGLLDYFFCPRFSYGGLSALVDTYAGATFSRVLRETSQQHVYEFQRGTDRLVVGFTPDGRPRPVTVESDAKQAVLVDPMGNRQTLDGPGEVVLKCDYLPVTIMLDGATDVKLR